MSETGAMSDKPLTKPTHTRVEGFVYCHEHTTIHVDSTDPYGYGEPDCKRADHRPVYAGMRAGDYRS